MIYSLTALSLVDIQSCCCLIGQYIFRVYQISDQNSWGKIWSTLDVNCNEVQSLPGNTAPSLVNVIWYWSLYWHWSMWFNVVFGQLDYDFILHYEDLETDWNHLLKDLNITENLSLPHKNKSWGDKRSYYQNISREDMLSLYQKYEADFLMFRYSLYL